MPWRKETDRCARSVGYSPLADELWKSEDGGKTWQRLATAPGGITALAVHPVDQDRVFAGTGHGRLFRSADGGVSWQAAR